MNYQNLKPEAFEQGYKGDPNAVILDVRTQAEVAEKSIPNAVNIDYYASDFDQKLEGLDKSKNYYVYCRSGGRSGNTCSKMSARGFKGKLFNLEGGMLDWNGETA